MMTMLFMETRIGIRMGAQSGVAMRMIMNLNMGKVIQDEREIEIGIEHGNGKWEI